MFSKNVPIIKAFADEIRLKIVSMLSRGELCACKILEKLSITQPTLSHHMKILCDCGLVTGRKDGKWTYYSLNQKAVDECITFLQDITTSNKNCICNSEETGCCN